MGDAQGTVPIYSSPLLLWRHLVGGSGPNMAWFSVAFDTLLFATTAVTLPFCYWRRSSHYWAGHPTVWGPTVRQLAHSVYLWIPEYFLVIFYVFGLVGTFIKTNFVFRYARYAIKSDYSNLIFNLCLRFLSWRHFLQQNSLNSIFFCLSTIYPILLGILENSTSCAFPSRNRAKGI